MAHHYVHTGMISLDGVKMSKSLGNLVFVHKLTEAGHDASAIRLAVFAEHYRADRDFSTAVLDEAERRLAAWRGIVERRASRDDVEATVTALRAALAEDLDTPKALRIIDEASGDHDSILRDAIDGLLGVKC